jgi:hypothetical protein
VLTPKEKLMRIVKSFFFVASIPWQEHAGHGNLEKKQPGNNPGKPREHPGNLREHPGNKKLISASLSAQGV